MTDIQKLGANERLLRATQKDILKLQNPLRAVESKFMLIFPDKDEAWVRETMIRARQADLVNYQSIVEYYRKLLGMRV